MDTHWEQQFLNYQKALSKLTVAITLFKPNEEDNLELEEVDDLLKDGMIQRFEYTHELSLDVMKAFAASQRNNALKGARDVTREGIKLGLISDAEKWMAMLETRKETLLMYKEETADEIFEKTLEIYYLLLLNFEEKMEEIRSGK
ncbi:MAG: HI0074 family nucleotidyltransferase substrate-binding subunit [Bacteroidales bacterium]